MCKFFPRFLPTILLVCAVGYNSLATVFTNNNNSNTPAAEGIIIGELRKWHKVTITFNGPTASEQGSTNPFLDYRLNVTFTHVGSGKSYLVPGFFAADGNAAESSATSGNKWRVHFAPDETGTWNYQVSFRQGSNVAVSDNQSAGSGTSFDGDSGSFNISSSNKTGRDLRGKGRLEYVGEHYLRFAETGDYFIKGGADAPENLLAYDDFDGTYNAGGTSYIKSWSSHSGDWQSGDPTWKGTKGKELIGAVNYLSGKGMNVFSFLTMNINGDGNDVWMFTDHNEHKRYDVSKLAQWEIIFEHADKKGMYLHFKTQETENDQLLDGGNVGTERKLYYRELIARFGHHLALNWNLGEENTQSDSQRKAMAEYFNDHDPYQNHIVLHTYPGQQQAIYSPLLGSASRLTGVSIQIHRDEVHKETLKWCELSDGSGKNWVVANDEQGTSGIGTPPDGSTTGNTTQDDIRETVLWGNLMAGGAGVEYYFGYSLPCADLNCQDWRSRDQMWDYTRYALEFFQQHLPFERMKSRNDLIGNGNDSNSKYCFADPGKVYTIYLPNGGSTNLDLQSFNSTYEVKWYDPRSGGGLKNGSVTSISGTGNVSVGNPPSSSSKDWVVLVTSNGSTSSNSVPNADFSTNPTSGTGPLTVNLNGSASSDPDGNIVSYSWDFGNGTTGSGQTTSTIYNNPGSYTIKLTVTDNDGAKDSKTTTVNVNANVVGSGTAVTEFRLVNSNNGNDLGKLDNNDVIDLSATPNITIKANATSSAESVKFNLSGADSRNYTDTSKPYTLFGGNNNPWTNPKLGNYNLSATPYSQTSGGSGAFQEQNGIVVVEVESTAIVNQWQQGTDGNVTYYEATSDNFSNPSGGGILNYDIEISTPGIYRFEWKSKINSGNSSTDANDNWVKFPNNNNIVYFGYKGAVSSESQLTNQLQNQSNIVFPKGSGLEGSGTTPNGAGADGFFKVYMNSTSGWIWSARTSDNDVHDIFVKFNSPGVYPMQISNRSDGHAIDRVVLYKIDTYGNNYNDSGLTNLPESPRSNGGSSAPGDGLSINFSVVSGSSSNQGPVAKFSANPTSGTSPLTVNVDASASSDPDGNIVSYNWDFGNGTTKTGKTSSVTYNNPGTYSLKLTVTDDDGAKNSKTITINVSSSSSTLKVERFTLYNADTNQEIGVFNNGDVIDLALYPNVNIRAITNPSIVGSVILKLTGTANRSQTDNDAPYTLFGDENQDYYAWPSPKVGNYTLTATPSSEANGNGQKGTPLTINFSVINNGTSTNQNPVASFTANPTSGTAPLTVSVDASASSDPDGNIASYNWDFGNGTTKTGKTSSITYNNPGTYSLKLTVTDNDGAKNSKTIAINVSSSSGTLKVERFTLYNADTNQEIGVFNNGDVIDLALYPNVNIRAITNPSTVGSVILKLTGTTNRSQTESEAPYTLFGDENEDYYAWPNPNVGNYTLTATPSSEANGNGQKGTPLTINFSVINNGTSTNQNPVASFTANPTSGTAPLTVSVDASASSDPDGNIASYNWDFGNGTTKTGKTSSITYNNPGTYSLKLTVTDNDGAKNSKTIAINVSSSSSTQKVERFKLYNAGTNQEIGVFNNGDVIDLALYPNVNIRAITNPSTVGSVILKLTGTTNRSQTESEAPYSLFGDNSGNYNVWNPKVGNYTLKATPYTKSGGNGLAGVPLTINFSVTSSASSSVFIGKALSGFRLVNTENGEGLGQIRDGQLINLAKNPNISIEAISAFPEIESVEFNLSGTMDHNLITDEAPYAVNGYKNGDYLPLENLEVGEYNLIARPYYKDSNKRTISGDVISVNFSIINPIPIEPIKVYPNPSNGQFNMSFTSELDLTPEVYLYDLLGTRLTVDYLLESYFSGKYQLSVQTEELPNAIYILKLRVEDDEGRSGMVNHKISIVR